MTTEAPITVRDVLRLLLAADSYPRLGNHDWREADLLEAEALQKSANAEPRAVKAVSALRVREYATARAAPDNSRAALAFSA